MVTGTGLVTLALAGWLMHAPAPAPGLSKKEAALAAKNLLRGDEELWARYKANRALMNGGFVVIGLGGTTIFLTLFIGGYAELGGLLVNYDAVWGLVGTGAAVGAGGIAMAIVGGVRKRRIWLDVLERVTVVPTWQVARAVGPGSGASFSVRF